MALAITNAAASAAASAVLTLIDGGTGAGVIQIRTGAAPATADTADSGTLLATLTFSDPAFPSPTNGAAAASTITSGTAVADGTAGHFRVKTSAGTVVMQGSVGATSSGADMELVTTTITNGQPVSVTAFTYTQPKA